MRRLIAYFRASIGRQLVLSVALVHTVLTTIFVIDILSREIGNLREQHSLRAEGLAEMIATTSSAWVMSEDVAGLAEVIDAAAAFDGLRYAMILTPNGRVMAHSDQSRLGLWADDELARAVLSSETVTRRVAETANAIDVAAPIFSDGRLIGWAWVSLSREGINAGARSSMQNAVLFGILAVLVGIALAIVMARRLTHGLAALRGVTVRFRDGDRASRADEGREDELGDVARGFNTMLDAIEASDDVLRRQQHELAAAHRLAKLGAWRFTPSDGSLSLSHELEALIGGCEGAESPEDCFHPASAEDAEHLRRALDPNHRPDDFTFLFWSKTATGAARRMWSERRVERSGVGEVIAISGVCQDVTEREAAAEHLRQASKMEAVGQLTGGVAHDFNNLLTVVIGNLDLLEGGLDDKPEEKLSVEIALNAALRGAELTRQLLVFSRRQPLNPKPLAPASIARDLEALLRRTLGDAIEIVVEAPSDVGFVSADEAQLESAVLNLAVNARDAMPSGGRLRIGVRNVRFAEAQTLVTGPLDAGDYVEVAVEDNGSGIPEDVLPRVFDPFFTTKEVGRGTGLGLSMVYGFVQQSSGGLGIESQMGAGTTVRLLLPMVEADEHAVSPGEIEPATKGSEQILVVEDNDQIRRLVCQSLRQLGYAVVEARDGQEALRLLDERAVDLLFTDIMMPGGIDGITLAGEARRRRPDLKVLFTTGSADAVAERLNSPRTEVVLHKPYRHAELAGKVRGVLDGEEAA